MSWSIINGKLTIVENQDGVPEFTEPYPKSMWFVNENSELTNGFGVGSSGTFDFAEPYPLSLWAVQNNKLTNPQFPDGDMTLGAFSNALHLTEIQIPYTTTVFGLEAFRNTISLQSVDINIMSEYYDTTFNDECRINYKDIQYYISKHISELTINDDIVTFGTCDTLDSIEQIYDGGSPKYRVRTPNNKVL